MSTLALLFSLALPGAHLPATGQAAADSFAQSRLDFSIGEKDRTGVLVTPGTRLPSPAVVVLVDRSDEHPSIPALTKLRSAYLDAGVAVLLLESPSDGLESLTRQSEEGLAAIRALRMRQEIEPTRVGLWSLGGTGAWVGSLIASKDPDLAFLVLVSAPMETPEVSRLRTQGLELLDRYELALPVVDRISRFHSAHWDYLDTGSGYEKLQAELGDLQQKAWYSVSGLPDRIRTSPERTDLPDSLRIFLDQRQLDPLESLSRVACPQLAVFGDLDETMRASEFAVKLHFLAGALDLDLTVRTYAGLGHDLTPVDSRGQPTDGMDPKVIEDMVQWTRTRIDSRLTASSMGRPTFNRRRTWRGIEPTTAHQPQGPRLRPLP